MREGVTLAWILHERDWRERRTEGRKGGREGGRGGEGGREGGGGVGEWGRGRGVRERCTQRINNKRSITQHGSVWVWDASTSEQF